MTTKLKHGLAVVVAVQALIACSTIAPYDQTAYEQATSTKAEALMLMDRASLPYGQNIDKIDSVLLDINKAYEYDKGRVKNEITISLWQKLLNPEGNLFGKFIHYWKTKSQLHPAYIDEKKIDIGDAFDQIIQLEQGKNKTGT
ncbi:MAG TPA: hypothetical protein VK775_08905 [Chthoniobacterales bacterium]|jgi:hypothetical protein|nr:hypothetical protein [Chthoniobacterales bacterium]